MNQDILDWREVSSRALGRGSWILLHIAYLFIFGNQVSEEEMNEESSDEVGWKRGDSYCRLYACLLLIIGELMMGKMGSF